MTIILFIPCYIIPSSLILFMNYQIIIYLKKAQKVRKDYIMKAPPAPRAIARVNHCQVSTDRDDSSHCVKRYLI